MATKKKDVVSTRKKPRPTLTPEARENRLIAKAYDLVESRLDDGTATSQETTTLMKLGTTKAKMEIEKLRKENELLRAKTEALESSKNAEELYREAINAMRIYGGFGSDDEDDYEVLY